MNITKNRQTHRYREQTSGYQWGEGGWEGKYKGRELKLLCISYKGYTVQHREYIQYFIITINGIKL